MNRLCVALVVSLGVLPASRTQPLDPPLVAALDGEWRGTGTVTGRASDVTLSWTKDVGNAFLYLRFRNSMAASAGRPAEVFEARGYYRLPSGTPGPGSGTWVDSRGVIFPIVFTVSADALVSDWGSESTERGRTAYSVLADGRLQVVDFVRTADGSYREFGRTLLMRAPR